MKEHIGFHLLENSFDYILSAAEHASLRTSRSWKYAILHLVAGIELLLKARLRNEHWSLLFQRIEQANEDSLLSGNFVSVDFANTVSRLQNISGINIDGTTMRYLDELRDIRNRIQHFAIDIELTQVKSLMVKGINFSLEFGRQYLSDEMLSMERQTRQIYKHLRKFEEFVSDRMKLIKPQLDTAVDLIDCPLCQQVTLIIGDGQPRCPFCEFTIEAAELAEIWGEGTIGGNCINCGAETLSFVLYNNEDGAAYCLSCGTTQRICIGCGVRFLGDGDYCTKCKIK